MTKWQKHVRECFGIWITLTIDENGYRNSAINQTEVDIVILGDSITFAKDSKVEIGDLFREEGLSALNLGMSGYGPQYYRDVYKKYVIEKGIKHKNVIVNIFVGNDFSDAVRYPSFKFPTSKGKAYYPWIINLMIQNYIKIFLFSLEN